VERDRQVKAFKQVCETVESDVMKDWQSQIDAWLKDLSIPNPYIVERKGESDYFNCCRLLIYIFRWSDKGAGAPATQA
jgi:hypothetical protein